MAFDKERSRWPKFSLRMLLVVVILIGNTGLVLQLKPWIQVQNFSALLPRSKHDFDDINFIDFWDSDQIVSSSYIIFGKVVIWNWRKGTRVRFIDAFDDGSYSRPAGDYQNFPKLKELVESHDKRKAFLADIDELRRSELADIVLSPDGARRALLTSGGIVIIEDEKSREELYRIKVDFESLAAVSFSPDGNMLVTGSSNGMIRVWKRQYPECWWGILYFYQFWLIVVVFVVIIYIILFDFMNFLRSSRK